MKTTANVQRIIAAAALTSGLISAGVAASAQTTAAPVTPATSNSTSSVALSTVDSKAQRQAELEKINADARRVEFRNFGTSL